MDEREQQERQELCSRLIEYLFRPNYQPVKPGVIAKKLGFAPEQRKLLCRLLSALAREGFVQWGPRHRVKPIRRPNPEDVELAGGWNEHRLTDGNERPHMGQGTASDPVDRDVEKQDRYGPDDLFDFLGGAAGEDESALIARARRQAAKRPNLIVGVFRRTLSGNGYVRPEASGQGQVDERRADVFIPARRALDAATGDLVLARVWQASQQGRRRGEVVEVLRREDFRFVGTFQSIEGQPQVIVDGRVFSRPVPVGDPTAKGVRPGDQVVIEMVRFPHHYDPGEAVIVEVLGPRGQPGVDTLAIIREYDLPGDFPEDVQRAARAQAEQFDESIGPDRQDFTADVAVTIDPEDARDFDDAVSVVVTPQGNWRLAVHIADVAHFVPEGSALDREARRRGTSVYLPDRVIPMLPELISNHLASLQPHRIRYTRSVLMEFSPEGQLISSRVARSAIRSRHRFSYDEVDQVLEHPRAWKKKLAPEVWELVPRMRDLAMLLRRRRLEHGAIELAMPEVKILLDENGRVSGARLVRRTVSHQIIEEFMLAANRAVAEILAERHGLFLRRVHEPPNPIKLKSLTEFVRLLGIPCSSMESRFEIKRVLELVAGQPTEYAVNYAVLRSMQKAIYSPRPLGHYALYWPHYCHFTSPIRRYPDLVTHRIFASWEEGRKPQAERGMLRALGEHCSEREQRAEAAERELVKLKLLHYLHDRIGQRMDAVVTGVEEFGLFAQGVEIPAEGFISVSSLQDDRYRFDAALRSLVGFRSGHQYRLGDLLVVEVAHVDLARRELDFRVVRKLDASHKLQAPMFRAKSAPKKASTPSATPEWHSSSKKRKKKKGRKKK